MRSAGVHFSPYDFVYWLRHMTLSNKRFSNIYNIATVASLLFFPQEEIIKQNKILKFSQEFCSFNEAFCLYDDIRTAVPP